MKTHTLEAGQFIEFIFQPVEHCSANAEATGSNPVEAPKNFFSGYFCNCLNCDSLRWSHTHFICIPAVHIISFNVCFIFPDVTAKMTVSSSLITAEIRHSVMSAFCKLANKVGQWSNVSNSFHNLVALTYTPTSSS